MMLPSDHFSHFSVLIDYWFLEKKLFSCLLFHYYQAGSSVNTFEVCGDKMSVTGSILRSSMPVPWRAPETLIIAQQGSVRDKAWWPSAAGFVGFLRCLKFPSPVPHTSLSQGHGEAQDWVWALPGSSSLWLTRNHLWGAGKSLSKLLPPQLNLKSS